MEKKSLKRAKPSKHIVFFDFDNTIVTCDTFDKLLPLFSKDDRWKYLESQWQKGKIGSLECMKGQTQNLRVTKDKLDKRLAQIKLDPYFKKLIRLLRGKKIRVIILSDNYDYILKSILKNNAVKNLKIFANKLSFAKNRLIPSFPYTNNDCSICGHCKTKNLLANSNKDSIIIYVGDGRTDTCPAKYSDKVFAKKYLLKYCRDRKLTHFPFKNLKKVYSYFKESSEKV
jgi:2,3-diketo-5-methylthio-1-phosphopentane phosphatase